jgi:hypothetical protein
MIVLLFAGGLQLAVAAANLPLTRMLQFSLEHTRLTPIVSQIHRVHQVHMAGVLVVFAAISVMFPEDLVSGEGLGRFLSIVLALFWGARFAVQRLYYDREFLRAHRGGDVCFSAIFAALFGIYAAAAAGGLR